MKQPTISQARAICDALGARAVIVIALDYTSAVGSSYGETKMECKQTGQTLDEIIEAMQRGTIPVWSYSK